MDESHLAAAKHATAEEVIEAGMSGPAALQLPLTSLIGREHDVEQVSALLESGQARLVTLSGPGGVGKTRLALRIAARSHPGFSDGVYFVSLAPVANPDLVLSTIAQTLGVREVQGGHLLSSLCSALRDKHLLLILDNFEQIVSAAPYVADLLSCAPTLQVLVTSRTILHVYGEHEYQVSPLALPAQLERVTLEQLTQYDAVRLFIERARAVKPSFTVNNRNAPAVAGICQRLDGLPLAIELAAARIKLMSPQALLDRLDPSLPLLTGGAANLPLRHQTLRDTIAWSYNLLTEPEKKLFRAMSVFVGGFTLEAAAAVSGGAEAGEQSDASYESSNAILDGLTALIDKSLLRHNEQDDGEPRFSMLETIREFAWEKLISTAEGVAVGKRHTAFFLFLAERAEPEMMGANQALYLDRLAPEYDNLRAVFARAQLAGDVETRLRLGWALYHFWYIRGYLNEGRAWLSEAIEQCGDTFTAVRAKALNSLGNLESIQGNYEAGRKYHEQALAIWQKLEYEPGIAAILGNLGNTARQQGDYAGARALREQSIALYRGLGPEWTVAVANGLYNLSVLEWAQGHIDEARRLCEEALPLQRERGDTRGIASTLYSMGLVAAAQNDFNSSRAFQEESLTLSRQLGDKVGIASSLAALAETAADRGDYNTAHALHAESLRMRHELGTRRAVADCLLALAIVKREQADPIRLVRLLAAAEALCEAIGSTITQHDRARYEQWLEQARAKLGPDGFATAWEEGKRLTTEQTVTLALEESPAVGQPEASVVSGTPDGTRSLSKPTGGLTRREVEVLRLVAAGLTNHDIAAHLHVSINTLQTHIRSIYSKIDVTTRTSAVRYAFEHDLG